MANPSPTRGTLVEAEEGFREDHMTNRESNNLVMPEDGYGWKKYGQKFIKKIGKIRSYFKCHNLNCKAKKRAEWSASDRNSLRIVYEGVHTHSTLSPQPGSSQQEASASRVNQYNLFTQVFGAQNNDPS